MFLTISTTLKYRKHESTKASTRLYPALFVYYTETYYSQSRDADKHYFRHIRCQL